MDLLTKSPLEADQNGALIINGQKGLIVYFKGPLNFQTNLTLIVQVLAQLFSVPGQ